MTHLARWVAVLGLAFPVLLSPQDQETDRQIRRLISLLGSDDARERASAEEDLVKIGEPALRAVEEARGAEDPEVRARAEGVAQRIRTQLLLKRIERALPELSQRVPRFVERLASADPEAKHELLFELTGWYAQVAGDQVNFGQGTPRHRITPGELSAVLEFAAEGAADTPLRLQILYVISQMRPKGCEKFVLARLGDPDPLVRTWAADTARALSLREAVEPLVELLKDPVPAVRTAAGEALRQMRFQESITPLRRLLADTNGDTRACAIYCLSYLDGRASREAFVKGLDDPDAAVRLEAVRALRAIEDRASLPRIAKLFSDRSSKVRAEAAAVIGDLGGSAYGPGLVRCLRDSDARVRQTAIESLVRLGVKDSVRDIQALLQDPDGGVQAAAILALTEFKAAEAAPLIAKRLKDDRAELRESAAYALGELDAKASIADLKEALKDSVPAVREEAAVALAKLNAEDAVAPILDLIRLEDTSPETVAAALVFYPRERVVPALFRLVRDENPVIRANARSVVRSVMSADELVRLLDSKDTETRVAVLEVLAEAPDAGELELAPKLNALLKEENEDVRAAATTALGRVMPNRSTFRLLELISDRSVKVRRSAVHALIVNGEAGELEDYLWLNASEPERTQRVVEALLDLDDQVVGEDCICGSADHLGTLGYRYQEDNLVFWSGIIEALRRIGSPRALERLLRLCRSYNRLVARNASFALRQLDLNRYRISESLDARRMSEENFDDLRPMLHILKQLRSRGLAAELARLAAQVDESPAYPKNCALALAALGTPEARKELVALTAHSNEEVRIWALRALVQVGDAPELEPIIGRFLDSNAAGTAAAALEAIDALRTVRFNAKIADLAGSANEDLRRPAIRLCGLLGIRDAAPKLKDWLKAEDSNDRDLAAVALGRLESRDALPHLIELVRNGDVTAVEPLARLANPDVVSELVLTMKNPEADVMGREMVSLCLAKIGVREALGDLLDFAELSPEAAADAVMLLDPAAHAPLVIQWVRDRGVMRSERMALMVGMTHHKEAAGLLKRVLEKEPEAETGVLLAYGELGAAEMLKDLRKILAAADHSFNRAWIAAASSAVRLGARDAQARLVEQLRQSPVEMQPDADDPVSYFARAALKHLPGERLLELVRTRQKESVSMPAAVALGRLGAGDHAGGLEGLLSDMDPSVRLAAATALAELGDKRGPRYILRVEMIDAVSAEAAYFALGSLNACRCPGETARVRKIVVPRRFFSGSLEGVLKDLERATGVRIALDPRVERDVSRVFGHVPVPRDTTLAEALDYVMLAFGYPGAIVVESDGVRILSRPRALEFWRGQYKE